ncbi:acyl-CoA dehydrogenase [Aeromicrobium chenweiae]|nr:acyl-CoA dehydrogenase [Aeromicrobium chenweiae]
MVAEEMGKRLYSGPFLSTSVAGLLVERFGSEEIRAQILPGIAEGTRIATVSHPAQEAARPVATNASSGLIVTGDLGIVLDGHVADIVIAPALLDGVEVVVVIDLAGAVRDRLDGLDPTRNVAQLSVDGAPATVLGDAASAGLILRTARSLTAVLLAAEQVGVMQAVLDMSVDYAKMRHQFGRPIGSFQAIKHRCSDMFVALETSRSATYYAAWVEQAVPDSFADAAVVARLVSCEQVELSTASNLQIHGGIGFTWEHDAHLFVKRAKSSALLLGDWNQELDPLATRLLDGAGIGQGG